MTKKERRDVKDVIDLLIRCDRVIHSLIKDRVLVDQDIITDLRANGVTAMRIKLDEKEEKDVKSTKTTTNNG